ncbi:hypothetical protein Poli38472_005594 [Pythium oligandrum]|uniref:Uncharacterized protein n=1 Tax=Pythium oligandrum TaxID=41045 RepID=A0A8K1CGA7_PYTOL|nr:hypothetical protein Poli38472_005594 [Pythium oligandrum]|eukprot:TMW62976.1 hypothetical protein Poli38472_005594 [Pythium oligandrum]
MMNGTGASGSEGLPDAYAALTPSSSSPASASFSPNVSMAPVASSQMPASTVGSLPLSHDEMHPAKRPRLDAPAPPTAMGGGNANASMAAMNAATIAAKRAIAALPTPTGTNGSGMTTQQFLQSLPAAYAMSNPSIMMMMQQQQQQQQMNRPMANAAPVSAMQQHQANAMVMAAMAANAAAQNRLNYPNVSMPTQQMGVPTPTFTPAKPVTPQTTAASLATPSTPPADHPCYLCKTKGDVWVCNAGCGLYAHVRCIGEDKVFPSNAGQICASCFLMPQDRNAKENLQKGGTVGISVRRAILCLNVETSSPQNFDKFGHLSSLRMYEIAEIAGYPIGPFASKFVEPVLQRWIREKLVNIPKWPLNVRDVFTLMIGLYSLKRANIAHAWRERAVDLVQAKKFSVIDYFGWHPAIEGPQVRSSNLCTICCIRNPPELQMCGRCRRMLTFPSTFTKFASTLLATYYAEQIGLSLGTTVVDVFAHTNTVRGLYKGLKPLDGDGYDWESFAEQMRSIFGLLDVVSHFGVLQLNPEHFEPEIKIIFNPLYLNQAMLAMEYEVVGRFLQCLKLFGPEKAADARSMIENCERFLLMRQLPNGSWCKMTGSVVDQYKATVQCAKALVTPVFRGFGPTIPDLRRYLEKWAKKMPLHAQRLQTVGDGKLLVNGVTVHSVTLPQLKKIDVFYRRQIIPTSGLNSLETLATARLRAILASQKDDVKIKEEVSATTDNEDTTENESINIKTGMLDDQDITMDAQENDEDTLTKLSLNGELSLFDGLKFEDGDVIDMSHHGVGSINGEDDDDQNESTPGPDSSAVEDEGEDIGDDMYDDDDDDNDDGGEDDARLPEPEPVDIQETGDVGAVEGEETSELPPFDESFSQASIDLALDM